MLNSRAIAKFGIAYVALVLLCLTANCSRAQPRPIDHGKPSASAPRPAPTPSASIMRAPRPGAVRVELIHEMIYQYDHPVRLGEQILRVHPLLDDAVPIVEYSLSIEPVEHSLRWQQDDFGNAIARVAVPGRTTKLAIRARVVADVQTTDRALPTTSEPLGRLPFSYPNALRAKLSRYLPPNRSSRELGRYIQAASRPGRSMLEFALGLNRKFAQDVRHTERLEPGVQSPSETLELGSGSCRDSAWLLVQTLRQAGIAARFVSGYLVELAEPGSDSTDDSLSFHAWCEFYLPSAGWIALDPSLGRPISLMYIPLAAAPSPELVAPLDGMVEVAETDLSFPMRVRRITANAAPP